MASGRVGGTASKKSGSVGDTTYLIVRNPDGSYSQVVRVKGVQTVTFTSPRLQAQRMCMAMVESLMKDITPIAKLSIQSAANKSKSLNAFSSFNTQLVARDCKTNWYGGNRFLYPVYDRTSNYAESLGGPWTISSGTLQRDAFDYCGEIEDYYGRYLIEDMNYSRFWGLKFDITPVNTTVGNFLYRHRITRLDKICLVVLRHWFEPVAHSNDDVTDRFKYEYAILEVNPAVSDSELMTLNVCRNLFVSTSSYTVAVGVREDYSDMIVGFQMWDRPWESIGLFTGGFTISYIEGRKMISPRSMTMNGQTYNRWLLESAPANVFYSWMMEEINHDYPSPF